MALKFVFLPFKGLFDFVMDSTPVTPISSGNNLLLEDGFALLLESGDNLLLEDGSISASQLLLEDGFGFLLESGDSLLLEA